MSKSKANVNKTLKVPVVCSEVIMCVDSVTYNVVIGSAVVVVSSTLVVVGCAVVVVGSAVVVVGCAVVVVGSAVVVSTHDKSLQIVSYSDERMRKKQKERVSREREREREREGEGGDIYIYIYNRAIRRLQLSCGCFWLLILDLIKCSSRLYTITQLRKYSLGSTDVVVVVSAYTVTVVRGIDVVGMVT